MDENTLVSILIPVFNREEFIEPCIESALSQSYRNMEVIVVDNASIDGTWKICERYRQMDRRVRIFRNSENIGPVRNWMRCLEEARGQYVKILFSDDLIDHAFLSRTVPFLKDPEVGFVYTGTIIGSEPWIGRKTYFGDGTTGKYSSKEFIFRSLYSGSVPVSPGCALFRTVDVKRNLFLVLPDAAGTDFSARGAGSDLLLYLLTAIQYKWVQFVSEPLSFFRAHSGTITVRGEKTGIQEDYMTARLWFTNRFLDSSTVRRFNSLAWIRMCRKREKFTSLRSIGHPSYIRKYPSVLDVTMWLLEKHFIKRKYRTLNKMDKE